MTDSTAFNLKVFNSLCGYIEAEHSLTSVTCNMRMLMILQQKA